MSDLKTKVNDQSVADFLQQIPDERRRMDCQAILELMQKATGQEPKMWGDSIVGFGSYHYKGSGGREGDWFLTGFSPRKQNLTLYIMAGFEHYNELLARLGKHTHSVGCLYIKRLADVDTAVLAELVQKSAARLATANP